MKKPYIIILLIIGVIWDTATTIYGSMHLAGDGSVQTFISFAFAVALSIFLINSIPVIENPSKDIVPRSAKFLLLLAIAYDFFTAFEGNYEIVLKNADPGVAKIIFAIGLTIAICICPIYLSYHLFKP